MAVQKKKSNQVESKSKSKTRGGEDESSMSKADAFDNAKAGGAVAAGKYDAIVKSFVLQDPDEKGHSARITHVIASEGDEQGHTITQWYKLFEVGGEPARGLEFLKKDLAILGHPDVKFKDLEATFEEITEEHPGVVLTVKHKDGFVNAYIQGLCEDSDVIDEYKENNPF